jgi:clan AA aspartic protease
MDSAGHFESLEVVIDTGFTGYLTLPTDTIQLLGLPSAGRRIFELANGERFGFTAYLATVSWHGRLSDALVLQSDSAPLLGMDLLRGSRVTMDVLEGGHVIIEEL